MAGKNDFTLSFGSNASTFAAELVAGLKPVREEIAELAGLMKRLPDLAAQQGAKTAEALKKAGVPEGIAGSTVQVVGGGGGGGGVDVDWAQISKDVKEHNKTLNLLFDRLAAFSKALAPATVQVKKDRERANRRDGADRAKASRWRDPVTGESVKKGTPGAVPFERGPKEKIGKAEKPSRQSIADVTNVMIDDASMKRLVNAMDANTKALKSSTAAMKSGVVVARGAAPASGGGGKDIAAGTLRNQLDKRQRLAALKQEMARAQSGGEFDSALFAKAAGTSKRFPGQAEAMGYKGAEYVARLQKSIDQLTRDLKGVPRAKALRAQLADAGVVAPKASTTKKAAESTGDAVDKGLQDKIASLESKAAQIADLLGDADDETRKMAEEMLAQVRAEQAALAEEAKGKKALAADRKSAARAEREELGISKKEQSERRRAKAQAKREAERAERGDPSLTQQQRKNISSRLELAGSEDVLRKQSKESLRQIAEAFQGEGYQMDFNPRASKAGGQLVTNDRLVQAILGMQRELAKTGKTFHDLTVKNPKIQAESMSPAARKVLDELVQDLKLTPADEEAYATRRRSRQTGGEDEPIRGRQQYGGAYQQGDDFREVMDAQKHIANRNADTVPRATLDAAMRAISRGTNVFDPELSKGITGENEEARRALSAIRRATTAIDKMAEKFIALRKQINDTEISLAAMEREQTSLERLAAPDFSDEERLAQLVELRAKAEERLLRLQNKYTDMIGFDPERPEKDDNSTIEALSRHDDYRERAALRKPAQDQAAEDVKKRAEEAYGRQLAAQLQKTASAEMLVGGRTRQGGKAGGTGDQFADFTRGLPGLTSVPKGKNAGTIRAVRPEDVDPSLLKKLNSAKRSYDHNWEAIHKLRQAETVDLEKVAELEKKAFNDLRKLVNAYNKMGLHGKGYEAGRIVLSKPVPLSDAALARRREKDPNFQQSTSPMVTYRTDMGIRKPTPGSLVGGEGDLKLLTGLIGGRARMRANTLQTGLSKTDEGKVLLGKATELARQLGTTVDDILRQTIRSVASGSAAKELEVKEQEKAYRASLPKKEQIRESAGLLEGDMPPELNKQFKEMLKLLRIKPESLRGITGVPDRAREALDVMNGVMATAKRAPETRQEIAAFKQALAAVGGPGKKLDPQGSGKQVPDYPMKRVIEELRKFEAGLKLVQKAEAEVASQKKNALVNPKRAVQTIEEILEPLVHRHAGENSRSEEFLNKAEAAASNPDYQALRDKLAEFRESQPVARRDVDPKVASSTDTAATTKATSEKKAATAKVEKESASRDAKTAELNVKTSKAKNAAANSEAAAKGRAGAEASSVNQSEAKRQKQARNEIRDRENLLSIAKHLSAETQKEMASFAALVSAAKASGNAGAANAEIAEAMVPLYAKMANDLKQAGMGADGIRQSFQAITASGGKRATHDEVSNVSKSANMRGLLSSQKGTFEEEATDLRSVIADKLFGGHGFWGRIANSTGTFIIRNFSAGIVFGLTAALSDVVRQAIETESTFIRVSQALDATGRSVGSLRTGLQGISTKYGVALEDVYNTAAGLTGLFEDVGDIEKATEVAAQLQMISNGALNAAEAMGTLGSITSAFEFKDQFGEMMSGADSLEHVADVLTAVQNRLGVNIETTAEGVGRLAGLANMISLSFEETAVYVAEIAKKTNQTGAAAGEQFSRIIATMQTGRGQQALQEAFPDSGMDAALAVGDYSASLKILMRDFEALGKTADGLADDPAGQAMQDRLTTTLGGARQAAATAALLKDGADALDNIRAATYANGEAQKRATEIAQQLNVALKRLQANFVNLGSNLIRTGILDFFGGLMVAVNGALGVLNTLLSVVNEIAQQNSFVKFLFRATSAMLGLAVAIKLVRAGLAGFKAYAASPTAGGAAVRGFQQPLIGGGTGGNQGRSLQERLQQRRIDKGLTVGPAPGAKITSTARGLEAITAKPLRAFGEGLDKSATSLRSLARAQEVASQDMTRTSRERDVLAQRAERNFKRADSRERFGSVARNEGDRFQNALRGEARDSGRLNRWSESIANRRQSIMSGAAPAGRVAGSSFGLKSMNAASKGLSGLGTAATRLGSSATLATTASLGLMIAIGLVTAELFRAKAAAEDTQRAYEALWGKDADKTEAQKAEAFVGPATDLVTKNRKSLGGFDGVTRAISSNFVGMLKGQTWEETSSRNAGDVDPDLMNKVTQPLTDGLNFLRLAGKQQTLDIEAVQDTAKRVKGEMAAEADKVMANSDLSSEQKQTLLAQLEAGQKALEETTSAMILNLQGIAKADQYMGTEIDEILKVLSVFQSSPTAGANHASAMEALLKNAGLDPNGDSSVEKNIKAMLDGSASTEDLLGAQLSSIDTLLASAEAVLASKTESGADPDEIEAAAERVSGLMNQYESTLRAQTDAIINGATEMATGMRNTGDFAGAEAALNEAASKIREKLAASDKKRRDQKWNKDVGLGQFFQRPIDENVDVYGDEESEAMRNRALATGQQAVEAGILAKTKALREKLRTTRNAVEIASIQEQIANIRLEMFQEALGLGNATAEQVEAEEEAAIERGRAAADAQQALIVARGAAAAAGVLNSVSKAQIEESAAWQALSYARSQFGTNSVEYLSALASARSAAIATQQAILDQMAAQRELELAMMPPADLEGRARKALANAQAAQRDAERFGRTSTQYLQATQQVIEAQRGVDQAVYDIADASANLAIAIATAAGKMVDVAALKLEMAREALERARKRSGGKRTKEVIDSEAALKQAEADQRDAILQDRLDTIDFMQSMDQITSRGAIGMLQDLLNMKDLTEKQRRDILMRIKSLQDELNASMQGAFNLPDTIKPPTVYEVRRALGVDEYLRAMSNATDISGITNGGAPNAAQQAQNNIAAGYQQSGVGAASGVPQSQDYSNSNNTVTINGANFDQIVGWLKQYLGEGAQVIRTVTPRRH